MSKFKGKLARRIMAIVLSGAMVMSNMSAYAAELTTEAETEVVTEVEETAAEEADVNNDAVSEVSSEASASKTTKDKDEADDEDTADAATTESVEEEASSDDVETDEADDEEETTEFVTTEEETTEKETTEEETTIEDEDNEAEATVADKVTYNQGSWGADNSRTTSWDFITTYPSSASTLKIGDTLKGIKVIATKVQLKAAASGKTVGQGFTLTKDTSTNGTIAIPLDGDTEKVSLTIKMASLTDDRYIVIGKTTSKKVWHGTTDNNTSYDSTKDGIFSKENNTWTEEYGTAYMTTDSDGKWLYIEGCGGDNKIESISITETKPGNGSNNDDNSESKVYELKASEVETGVLSAKVGKDDFFTVRGKNATTNISVGEDGTAGEFTFTLDDETLYTGTGIKWGGSPSLSDGTVYASAGFTVPSGYMAEINVGVAAKAKAAVGLYGVSDGSLGIVGNNTLEYAKDTPTVATFSYIGEGTYYIGNTKKDGSGASIGGGNTLLYYVRVTLTKVKPVAWENVPNPKINSASQTKDKDEIIVNLSDAVINASTGSETVKVTMYRDADCTTEVQTVAAAGGIFNATDGSATATFAPGITGAYYFKAVGSRSKVEDKEDVRKSNVYGPIEFVLPLTVPVMVSADNIGEGKVEVTWGAVKEATGYDLKVYSDKALTTEAEGYTATEKTDDDDTLVTYTVEGLTVGNLYYFVAAAVRETEGSEESEKTDYSKDYIRVWVTQNKDATKYHIQEILDGQKLEVGKTYGGGSDGQSIMTLEVLPNAEGSTNEDGMPSSAIAGGVTIGGVTYSYSIQGKDNASPNKGEIPTAGAAFKITPIDDSVITFVTGAASGKAYHFIQVETAEDGKQTVLDDKTDTSIPEGSLKFNMSKGYTYYFYADGSKPKVYDIVYSLYVDNGLLDWNKVDAPVITNIALSSDKSSIEVTVEAAVGSDGGNSLTVEMYNENGETSKTGISTTEASSHKISLTPSSSGSYTFKAVLERETTKDADGNETEYDPKESEKSNAFPFTLPLSAPAMSSITNMGGGTIEIEWVAAKEANGYIVKVYSDAECKTEAKSATVSAEFEEDGYTVKTASAKSVNIEGLTVGETYYIQVAATRKRLDEATQKLVDDTSAYCDAVEKEITQDAQTKWSFAAYGSSTSITSTTTNKDGKTVPKNGYSAEGSIEANADSSKNGTVNVWSMGGAGKVVPNTIDGLAFYYTEIDPKTTNFTLKATAHVNEWVLSNGQDGFGLMAADQVGENGNGDYLWTNSYQAVVSKIEYNWDGEKVTTDTTKPKIAMKIGVGATEKVGATKEDVDKITAGDISTPLNWSATQTPLDTTYAKYAKAGVTTTCNMVGNAGAWDSKQKKWVENPAPSEADELYVDFELTLQKNNTGYFLSYKMPNGTVMTQKYYDTEALNHIKDNVYVGFFAARNANVTFKDIEFITIDPKDDAPAEEQPTKYINLTNKIASASVTNTSDYDLIFTSIWDGVLEVRDSENKIVGKADVTGSLDTVKSALKDGDNDKDTKAHIELSGLEVGNNVFTLTFTPSRNMKNPPAYTALTSYDPVTIPLTVEYRKYGEEGQNLYVSPEGKSTGTGTSDDPLDIYTAIKYVQPGQTILLAGGRYNLYNTITIATSVNGKPDIVDGKETYKNYIKMMADPNAKERPVFDFGGRVTGMTLGGNYWYFKGFDVTRSLDGQKGIQLSGSNNVLDQVNTYMNGNTGIQVSGSGNDTYRYWPQNNLVLNCTSFLNSDHGYEDADGFAAKLTIGSGNVFDGCIAAYNADDGWDLFAKLESGQIGSVTIRNCVAYKNGYVLVDDNGNLDLEGTQKNAGNGNGFKMGGDGLPGGSIYDADYKVDENGNPVYAGHKLINSVAFSNKSKGFDSNSCSNNKIYNSISFNNEGSNVALYTYSNVKTTGYVTDGVISYRTKYKGVVDEISAKNQNAADYTNNTTYLWNTKEKTAMNAAGDKAAADWFESITFKGTNTLYADKNNVLLGRNADGTINMGGFLELTDKAGQPNAGLGGQPSADDNTLKGDKETDGTVSVGNGTIVDDTTSPELSQEKIDVSDDLNKYQNYGIYVKYLEEVEYTGTAVQPEIRVYLNGVAFTDYKVSYKNNVNAYVEGDERYAKIPDTKRPTLVLTLKGSYQGTYEYYFDINPVNIETSVSVSGLSGVADGKTKVVAPTLIYNGKKLSAGKDYVVDDGEKKSYSEAKAEGYDVKIDATKGTSGNFTGVLNTKFILLDPANATDISKAPMKLSVTSYDYVGESICPKPEGYDEKTMDIDYINNIEVGKATITVTGKPEAGTVGSKTIPFTIKKTALKAGVNVDVANFEATKQYTGAALSQGKITVKLKDIEGNDIVVEGVKKGSKDVNEKVDGLYRYGYTYQYKANTEAGGATLTIAGIHNYTGTVNYKFKIEPAAESVTPVPTKNGKYEFTNKGLEVIYAPEAEYTPSGTTTNVVIKYNGNTVSKKNYAIAFKNNKNANDNATTVISWKGSLKGTAKTEFNYTVTPCDFTSGNITAKSVSDVFTNGKPSIKLSELEKSKVVLVNVKKPLAKNRDYTLTYEYGVDETGKPLIYDPQNKEAGKTEITIDENKGLDVTVYAKPVGSNFKPNEEGIAVAEFRVAYYDIAKVKIQVIDKLTEKTTPIYFVDGTEQKNNIFAGYNKLNNHTTDATTDAPYYIMLTHATGELEFSKFENRGSAEQKDYTYDYDSTEASAAGKQSVTLYGTGKFGGSRVYKYTLVKKTYDLKKINAAKDITATIATPDNADATQEAIKKALEGKIVINGSVLSTEYVDVSYDASKVQSGKSLSVTLTGATVNGIQVYSGFKTISIKVQ